MWNNQSRPQTSSKRWGWHCRDLGLTGNGTQQGPHLTCQRVNGDRSLYGDWVHYDQIQGCGLLKGGFRKLRKIKGIKFNPEDNAVAFVKQYSLLLPHVCLDSNPASISKACVTLRKLFNLSTLTPLHKKIHELFFVKLSSNCFMKVKFLFIDLRDWSSLNWRMKVTNPRK